jgi:ABC-type glutathione transport system ATPase component
MSNPALELRDVEVVYERRGTERVRAVAGASLTVERGQIVGLVGESGCGKSSAQRSASSGRRPEPCSSKDGTCCR